MSGINRPSDLAALERAAAHLPFTRLVHFTPARNLTKILQDGLIRSSKDLADNVPEAFTPTDRQRFDEHPNHVCCTFEQPNAYYRDIASKKPEAVNYPHWVHLTLDRDLVLVPGALFAPCNAARDRGHFLKEGAESLLSCWANPSIPQGFPRHASHLPAVPTDLQTEVLIPGPIPLSAVTAIIVASAEYARELYAALARIGLGPDRFTWKVAPLMYQKFMLASAIHSGRTPGETIWSPLAEERA